MDNYETIWIKKPQNLITYYDSFSIYTNNNPFNALTRTLLICLFLFVIFKRHNWSYVIIILIFFVTFFGYLYDEHYMTKFIENEIRKGSSCRRSTVNNPMSNLLPLITDPERKACEENKEKTDKNLHKGYYRNQNDYVDEATMRSFVTLPVTDIHGHRDEFVNFILNGYEKDSYRSCKYDGYQCETYRDIRYKV